MNAKRLIVIAGVVIIGAAVLVVATLFDYQDRVNAQLATIDSQAAELAELSDENIRLVTGQRTEYYRGMFDFCMIALKVMTESASPADCNGINQSYYREGWYEQPSPGFEPPRDQQDEG